MRKNKGFAFHCHHRVLMEWCYDYEGRVRYIKKHKSVHERKDRLRWFQFVKGKLPARLIKTRVALDKAINTEAKTYRAYSRAITAHTKASTDKAWAKACDALNAADAACAKALKIHQKAIEKLHAKECPDCSWNGKELVFVKHRKKRA